MERFPGKLSIASSSLAITSYVIAMALMRAGEHVNNSFGWALILLGAFMSFGAASAVYVIAQIVLDIRRGRAYKTAYVFMVIVIFLAILYFPIEDWASSR